MITLVVLFVLVTVASVVFNVFSGRPDTLSAPDGRDVQIAGVRVHYRQWGTSGTPIVIVPGFLESTVSFEQSAASLARTHRVYALDLPGFGYSQYSGHYRLADQAAVVDGFIRTLGLARPVLVGHSMGAAVAGSVALAHPADVAGVIFADGDALSVRMPATWIRWLMVHSPYLTSAYRIATGSPALAGSIIRSQCSGSCPVATDEVVRAWMRPLRQAAAEKALQKMSTQSVPGMTPARIQQISVPRGIIWGANDSRSGGSLPQAQANLHHPPTIVIPAAGHLVMMADPAGFANAIERLATTMR